jgi:hypothetical protein
MDMDNQQDGHEPYPSEKTAAVIYDTLPEEMKRSLATFSHLRQTILMRYRDTWGYGGHLDRQEADILIDQTDAVILALIRMASEDDKIE